MTMHKLTLVHPSSNVRSSGQSVSSPALELDEFQRLTMPESPQEGNPDGFITTLYRCKLNCFVPLFLGTGKLSRLSRDVTPPLILLLPGRAYGRQLRRQWHRWFDAHIHLRRFLLRQALGEVFSDLPGFELDQLTAGHLAEGCRDHISPQAIRWSIRYVSQRLESEAHRFWIGVMAYERFWAGRLGIPHGLVCPLSHEEIEHHLTTALRSAE